MLTEKQSNSVLAWHFVADTGLLRDGQTLARRSYYHLGELKMCVSGLHASIRALDALKYAPGSIVCRVRCSGAIVESDDKLVASERTVLWYADATKALHTFACDEAERALSAMADPDPRSIAAIAVKRRWIDGKATDAELAAARDAAWAVAMDAAWAVARDAAGAVARAAAWAAAWAAAGDAAEDARAAAMAAAMGMANIRLEATLNQLAPKFIEVEP
jgi:hypothetical protein